MSSVARKLFSVRLLVGCLLSNDLMDKDDDEEEELLENMCSNDKSIDSGVSLRNNLSVGMRYVHPVMESCEDVWPIDKEAEACFGCCNVVLVFEIELPSHVSKYCLADWLALVGWMDSDDVVMCDLISLSSMC